MEGIKETSPDPCADGDVISCNGQTFASRIKKKEVGRSISIACNSHDNSSDAPISPTNMVTEMRR